MNFKIFIEERSVRENGFLYPNWESIDEALEIEAKSADNEAEFYNLAYLKLSRVWLSAIQENLVEGYEISETKNFLILCKESIHIRNNLMRQCEISLKLILDEFDGHLEDSGSGKHILIVFKGVDEYFKYISHFSGMNSPASGGMCIHSGYTHIVLPQIYDQTPVAEITHELTHALLAQHYVPNWLDEAIAMRMEDISVNKDGLALTKDDVEEHFNYWNEENIQEFWSGEIWYKASEGFKLSYELSRILWKKLMIDIHATKAEVVEFIKTLSYEDSGNAAFKSIFNYSLGDLVRDFLGEGNWDPDEAYLKKIQENFAYSKVWLEEVLPLLELSEEELKRCSVSEMKPSPELSNFFSVLGVTVIGDYLSVSAEKISEFALAAEDCGVELKFKCGVLELEANYEKNLYDLERIFSHFMDCQISSGYVELNRCVLVIQSYLAEMISPGFKQFKLNLEGFDNYRASTCESVGRGDLARESISLEEMLNANPVINGAVLGEGELTLQCSESLETEGKKGMELAFYASSVVITDEEGREYSPESLEILANQYWDEG